MPTRIPRPKTRVDPVRAALERLAEAQEETQGEVRELAQAQRRTEERLEALALRVDQLTSRVDQLTERLGALTKEVQELTRAMRQLVGRLGNIEGQLREPQYQDNPFSFFQRVLRRMRIVPKQDLDALASDLIDRGQLTDEARDDLLNADLVLYGRPRDPAATSDAYLVVEISATIDANDVARAVRRSELLARITGEPSLAAVAGTAIDSNADAMARPIWRVFDGIAVPPGQPVPESVSRQQ